MRQLRPILAVVGAMALLVACSSTPGASTGNGGASQPAASTGGGASQPAASVGGGGGGGIFGNGSAKYHITGDYTADGELGFIPAASQIDQNGTYSLSFSNEASDTVLIIQLNGDAKFLSYGDPGHSLPAASCDFNITRQDGDGAAGTFNCNNVMIFTSTGSTTGHANVSGEFDARK